MKGERQKKNLGDLSFSAREEKSLRVIIEMERPMGRKIEKIHWGSGGKQRSTPKKVRRVKTRKWWSRHK